MSSRIFATDAVAEVLGHWRNIEFFNTIDPKRTLRPMELKGRRLGIISTPSQGAAMQGPHKASAHAPQQPSVPVPVATVSTLPARPPDSAVSYVMQTTEAPPHTPPDFWDKWGPSGLAFLGVIVTLYGKWAFDAWKQKRDIKRKLYLKVADAMFEGGLLLGSFSNTDLPSGHFANGFARCMAPLAKAEMVAGNKLLLALSDLRDKFGPAYFSLFRERARIEPVLTRVRNRLPFIQQATDRINANLAEQNRLAIDGVQHGETQERFDRLQESFKHTMDERQGYYNDNAKDIDVINPACEGMNRLAMDHAHELIPARVRVLSMMRKELKFRFNERQYLRWQIKMAEKAMAELDLTHQTIRESVKPGGDDSGQGKDR